jgi:hypothetical protein
MWFGNTNGRNMIHIFSRQWHAPEIILYISPVSLNCPLIPDHDDPVSRTSCSVPVADNTGSQQTWSQVVRWLEHCRSLHGPDCNSNSGTNFTPTRLLNVGEAGKVRLQTRFSDSPVRYVTLSHRWGATADQRLVLNTGNLHLLQRNIDMNKLSPIFKDAVEITRRLGLSFLWIDCLCIIQGDEPDWQHEASTMGNIYKNGVLNISANSGDATEGCFQVRDPTRVALFPVKSPGPSEGEECTFAMYPSGLWVRNVKESPVNSRGWV